MIKILIKEKSITYDVLVFNFRITNVSSTNLNVQETNVQEASIFGKNINFFRGFCPPDNFSLFRRRHN